MAVTHQPIRPSRVSAPGSIAARPASAGVSGCALRPLSISTLSGHGFSSSKPTLASIVASTASSAGQRRSG